jgi:hypothetical protein
MPARSAGLLFWIRPVGDRVSHAVEPAERRVDAFLADRGSLGRIRCVRLKLRPARPVRLHRTEWFSVDREQRPVLDSAVLVAVHESGRANECLPVCGLDQQPDRPPRRTSASDLLGGVRRRGVSRLDHVRVAWTRAHPCIVTCRAVAEARHTCDRTVAITARRPGRAPVSRPRPGFRARLPGFGLAPAARRPTERQLGADPVDWAGRVSGC